VDPVTQLGETAGTVMDGAAGRPDVLASDADREAACGQLGSAFADGRLTTAEHVERVRAAYGARTRGELAVLTADLPAPAGGFADGPRAVPRDVDPCLLCALLICCPPAAIAWLLAARRRSRHGPGRRLAPVPAGRAGTAMRGGGW
jgi:Domain of unknown function (DUF1707)